MAVEDVPSYPSDAMLERVKTMSGLELAFDPTVRRAQLCVSREALKVSGSKLWKMAKGIGVLTCRAMADAGNAMMLFPPKFE